MGRVVRRLSGISFRCYRQNGVACFLGIVPEVLAIKVRYAD